MCTVSFIARRNGYALGMNRDEQLARPVGLPPRWRAVQGRRVLGPAEPGGGTWISVNDLGSTLALINWYAVADRVKTAGVSRGEIVRAAAHLPSPEAVTEKLRKTHLDSINPFRLVGIFQSTRRIVEWRWNLTKLTAQNHPWQNQQWVSSGFDEAAAQLARGQAFAAAQQQRSAGTLAWLRRLHRSHAPAAGPFSTCMHRPGAATVSYTEVAVSRRQMTMRHCPVAPCCLGLPLSQGLSRASLSFLSKCADTFAFD
ncbi:MAG TPA: NRDE family protein [Verrucomicrobiae bacterium]|jgi:hypothetical protein|nr:NRDE family protein [Verrucomicrobiae bacterium]